MHLSQFRKKFKRMETIELMKLTILSTVFRVRKRKIFMHLNLVIREVVIWSCGLGNIFNVQCKIQLQLLQVWKGQVQSNYGAEYHGCPNNDANGSYSFVFDRQLCRVDWSIGCINRPSPQPRIRRAACVDKSELHNIEILNMNT